jgi:DNA-binding transcriptional LysR family regulator
MDFSDLRIFKAVVEEGGITAAAKRLHRVQSNVTTRIKQLEASLGAKLFIREDGRLHLSPAGELFLGYADRILEMANEAREAISSDAPQGVLKLGTLESTAASRLPALLARYHEKYPAVRVELRTGTADAMRDALLSREVDAAFIADCMPEPQLDAIPAFDEELLVIAPRSWGEIKSPRDLREQTIVSFPKGCAYRRRLQQWLATGGVIASRTLEVSSYHAIVACVAAGAGIAVVPRIVLDVLRIGDDILTFSLPDRIRRTVTSLVWRKGETSWALKALQAEVDADRTKAQARKPPGRVVTLRAR